MPPKALVPGIHVMGQRMVWEGRAPRIISIGEAEGIARAVCDLPSIQEMQDAARLEIERITLAVTSVT